MPGKGGANLGCGLEVIVREVVVMRRAVGRLEGHCRKIDFQLHRYFKAGTDEGIVSIGEQLERRIGGPKCWSIRR